MRLKSCKMLAVPVIILFAITVGCADFGQRETAGAGYAAQTASSAATGGSKTAPAVPEPVSAVVSTATLAATGDLLMHDPILTNNYDEQTGSYDFSGIFTYIKPYVQKYDFAVANLEVTLAGNDRIPYRGYPCFNCPDEIVDAAKDAGFDMLLTANNHSNDSGLNGILRTAAVLAQKNMGYTGTRHSEQEKPYRIQNVNGINIGMMNYTYESRRAGDKRYLNVMLEQRAIPLVNSFSYGDLDSFYDEVKTRINQMKEEGADALVLFIHWGDEYKLTPNNTQKKIARKMCELGIDVIIGGHPHVIQPLEIIKSADGKHTTVCLYSTGNAVSNQRIYRASIKTGHTEDGILFIVTFSKYGDGRVEVTGLDALPTWVHLYKQNGREVFQIVPLDVSRDLKNKFGLQNSEDGFENAMKSHQRTMAIVKDGLKEFEKLAA